MELVKSNRGNESGKKQQKQANTLLTIMISKVYSIDAYIVWGLAVNRHKMGERLRLRSL